MQQLCRILCIIIMYLSKIYTEPRLREKNHLGMVVRPNGPTYAKHTRETV
jgi:hypothetical protein